MTPRSIPRRVAFAPKKSLTHAGWTLAAVIACSALAPRSASADPVLTFGEISLSARANLVGSGGIPDEDFGDFLPDEFGQVTTLFEPRTWTRYPTSGSPVPQGFLSTFMTTSRFGGVGISGIQQIHHRSAFANANYLQIVSNTGDADAGLFLEYTIPAIEASILAGASINPGGLPFSSRARAVLFTEHFLADSTRLGAQKVFDYELTGLVAIGAMSSIPRSGLRRRRLGRRPRDVIE